MVGYDAELRRSNSRLATASGGGSRRTQYERLAQLSPAVHGLPNMIRLAFAMLTILLLISSIAWAQTPAPAGMSLAEAAAKRFPQPVRVGDLIDRTVLQPLESRPVLGYVEQIVRTDDGMVKVVVHHGGLFGFGGRPIAVPVEAMVLLGIEMELVDLTPEQLAKLPTYDGTGATPITAGDLIHVGLGRPAH